MSIAVFTITKNDGTNPPTSADYTITFNQNDGNFYTTIENLVELTKLAFDRMKYQGSSHDWLTTNLQGYTDPSIPQGAVIDKLGGILTTDANGLVFRNGVRLGNAVVSTLKAYGDGIFGKGKTSGLWFSWSGTSWVQLVNYDNTVFP